MAELLNTTITGVLNINDDSNIFKVNKYTLKTDFFKSSIEFNQYFNMEV